MFGTGFGLSILTLCVHMHVESRGGCQVIVCVCVCLSVCVCVCVCVSVCVYVEGSRGGAQDRVSLYSSGCPGTHQVTDQAGLELTEREKEKPSCLCLQVLGLKACITLVYVRP